MDSMGPRHDEFAVAIASGDAGSVIRIVRQRRGMTQAQLGLMVGYSPSAISRLERGRLRLRDVAVLRRMASALAVRPELLGVSELGNRVGQGALDSLDAFDGSRGGMVLRRRFLAGAAGLAGSSLMIGSLETPTSPTIADAIDSLERACLTTTVSSEVASLSRMRESLRSAQDAFALGDYPAAIQRLTEVLTSERRLPDQHLGRPETHVLLTRAYALATETLIKVGGGSTTMMVADRAVRAARLSESPFAFAVAARQMATVLRHHGRLHSSIRLAIEAADGLRTAGIAGSSTAAAYAQSLCTTAYIVANHGNRNLALDLVREAAHVAHRIEPGRGQFDLAGVTLYSIGVHYALGDAAAAVTAASQIQAAQLPTAERRARYWCDVARAWDLYGNPQRTYAALTAAFREAPSEVRDRSSMRALVSRLLPHDRALSGLRTFAARLKVL